MHAIVSQGWYILRVVLEDLDGNIRFANYEEFKIEGPAENYKLTIGGYSGDAGNVNVHASFVIPEISK